MTYDAFLSYATEDKNLAEQLARKIKEQKINIWFDQFEMTLGHSLRRSIDYGLSESKIGIVLLSTNFLNKRWPSLELNAMLSGAKPILPIRHNISADDVTKFSLILSDIYSVDTSIGLDSVAEEIRNFIHKRNHDYIESKPIDAILTVGSAVGENVLNSETKIESGHKSSVTREELYGGSGLNYTCRLLSQGHAVFPILSVGRGFLGENIRDYILSLSSRYVDRQEITNYLMGDKFFCDKIETTQSTIIVYNDQRTILTQEPVNVDKFRSFVNQRIDEVLAIPKIKIKAVLIGHIYTDNKMLNPSHYGEVTKSIIDRFSGKALIFANFGRSQIDHKFDEWSDYLKNIHILQLSLEEARQFYSNNETPLPLAKIIRKMRKELYSGVITLDKFGAIGTFREYGRNDIFAWPFDLPNITDTTGAGDAFGAGLVSTLYKFYTPEKPFTFSQFQEAINEARFWAAYSCKTPGGANNCPDKVQLDDFKSELDRRKKKDNEYFEDDDLEAVELKGLRDSARVLQILDKAYD